MSRATRGAERSGCEAPAAARRPRPHRPVAPTERMLGVRVGEGANERDHLTVDAGEGARAVAERAAPVGVHAPRRRLEDDAGPVRSREVEVGAEVGGERLPSVLGV